MPSLEATRAAAPAAELPRQRAGAALQYAGGGARAWLAGVAGVRGDERDCSMAE
jgi:hypothetical protein